MKPRKRGDDDGVDGERKGCIPGRDPGIQPLEMFQTTDLLVGRLSRFRFRC